MRRACSIVVLAAAAALLPGCATRPPPPPLMSPLVETSGRYGYTEKKLADTRYKVTYFGPRIRIPVSPARRPPFIGRAKAQARELALWRGAQLAVAAGKSRFSVVDTETDVEVDVTDGGYHYPHIRYPFGYGHWGRPGHPIDFYAYPRAVARVGVALTVDLHDDRRAGAHDAAEVIRRARSKYGPKAKPARGAKTGKGADKT